MRKKFSDRVALILASGLFCGYLPLAPGSWASAFTLFLHWFLAPLGPGPYLLFILILSGVGVWSAARVAKNLGLEDPRLVVIDEIAGMLLTLWGLAADPFLMVAGFFLFRILDVFKPWPIRVAEKTFPGGWGIMADDLLAGLIGNLFLRLALFLFHLF
ncbi:MAG TPA: phosphatidylglycerophosphatase A [Thermodesulfatator sp.]|nr:phosphatidylglycerophosphatase A [Thermodesulfatator sp.]